MTRRLFMGQVSVGVFDIRISRPGYDAKTAVVSDPLQISFAASRAGGELRVSEIITITATKTWYNYTRTYSAIPVVLMMVRRGASNYITSGYSIQDVPTGDGGYYRYSQSDYSIAVEQTRIKLLRNRTITAIPDTIIAGDTIICLVMG